MPDRVRHDSRAQRRIACRIVSRLNATSSQAIQRPNLPWPGSRLTIAGSPGKRAYDIFVDCFKKGALVRPAGDVLVIAPPYIVEKSHIDTLVNTLTDAIKKAA